MQTNCFLTNFMNFFTTFCTRFFSPEISCDFDLSTSRSSLRSLAWNMKRYMVLVFKILNWSSYQYSYEWNLNLNSSSCVISPVPKNSGNISAHKSFIIWRITKTIVDSLKCANDGDGLKSSHGMTTARRYLVTYRTYLVPFIFVIFCSIWRLPFSNKAATLAMTSSQ